MSGGTVQVAHLSSLRPSLSSACTCPGLPKPIRADPGRPGSLPKAVQVLKCSLSTRDLPAGAVVAGDTAGWSEAGLGLRGQHSGAAMMEGSRRPREPREGGQELSRGAG